MLDIFSHLFIELNYTSLYREVKQNNAIISWTTKQAVSANLRLIQYIAAWPLPNIKKDAGGCFKATS